MCFSEICYYSNEKDGGKKLIILQNSSCSEVFMATLKVQKSFRSNIPSLLMIKKKKQTTTTPAKGQHARAMIAQVAHQRLLLSAKSNSL